MRELVSIPESSPFYSPFGTTLLKAEEEGSKWIVYLQASNELKDQENEITQCSALKKAADYYRTHGVLSWDHKHKELHDPSFIIGEPIDVAFNAANHTLIKGFLYKENTKAQGVWNNILSGAKKLGASVGGYILQKSRGIIKSVYWDETAITHKPMNDKTFGTVQNLPFAEFMKALMAGNGVNAASFEGGRALSIEDLDTEVIKIGVDVDSITKLFEDVWKAIQTGEVFNYITLLGFAVKQGYGAKLARQVADILFEHLPDVVNRL